MRRKRVTQLERHLRLTVVRERAALAQVETDWLALEAQAGPDVFFQSYGWTTSVWDFEACRDNPKFDPLIVLAFDGKSLVAVLPLERFSTGLRRVIAPIGFAYSQISNLIIAPGCDGKAVFAAILEAAAKTAPADNFLFPKVREACHLAKAMPADHHRTGETTAAPIVGLDTFPDYPSYLQTVRTKTRKNIRNMRNRLERVAPLVHHIASSAADTKGVIARTLAWRTERLHEQGLTSRAFSTSHFALFCDSLVGHPHMRLAAFSLRHGDNPLAEQWGFVHADRYYCYVTSRDGSHLEESPGKLHLAEIIRSSMDMNLSACDLGVPDMPYKQTWATHTVQIADCALPLTLKGKMICQIWDVFLRPILKRWILSAPKPIRAALLGLVGRAV